MFELEIINKTTHEILTIAGFSYEEAFKQAELNPAEWDIRVSTFKL